MARQLVTAWKDDELTVSGEYNAVEPNFNPEVGFVRRGNMSQYSGDVAWNPQLRRSDTIRNLKFWHEPRLLQQRDHRHARDAHAGGDDRHPVREQRLDQLHRQRDVRSPGAAVCDPSRTWRSRSATTSTAATRRASTAATTGKVGVTGNTSWGEFWNGDNTSYTAGLDIRPNYHLNVDLSYSRNEVTLPNGSFTTGLVGARILYGFTPRAFFNAFLQYNADTHQVSSNLRFNFTHHPLSDLYVVYNDRRDTVSGQLLERAFIVKLTNLFNF